MPSSLGGSLSWAIFPENIITGDVIIAAIEINYLQEGAVHLKQEQSPLSSAVFIL